MNDQSTERGLSADVARSTQSGLTPEARKYLSKIGRIGGKKSRRELSSEDARAMAAKRKPKNKQLTTKAG